MNLSQEMLLKFDLSFVSTSIVIPSIIKLIIYFLYVYIQLLFGSRSRVFACDSLRGEHLEQKPFFDLRGPNLVSKAFPLIV